MIRAIPEQDWPAFLTAFSYAHQGWLVTVHGASTDECGQYRDALRHISIEGAGLSRAVTIDLASEARVYVAHPRAISVQQSGDGLDTALEIENAAGAVTRVAFRAASASEAAGVISHREHHAAGLVNLLARTVLATAALVVLAYGTAAAASQHRRTPPPRPPAAAARVAVRGELIFIGGYFYDPFVAPYPWWPHPRYPGWYFPRYDYRAEVRVSASPKQASVYVDGFYAGIVDDFDGIFQRLLVPPGGHHLTLYCDGYHTADFDLYLQPGTSVNVHHAMERLTAGERSTAPAVAPPVPPPPDGSYRLPRTPPSTSAPAPPLPQQFGNIDIRVQPADADVRIDGHPALTSEPGHFVVAVGAGRHRVAMSKAGYVSYEAAVDVRESTTATLNVMLPLEDGAGK
jgi:hypothetical protein